MMTFTKFAVLAPFGLVFAVAPFGTAQTPSADIYDRVTHGYAVSKGALSGSPRGRGHRSAWLQPE
jgi:hypothetical protein